MKKINGITLVALVVTIVVLLILAGVSLSLILGQNGIITKAQEGSKEYQQTALNEQILLNKVVDYLYGENNAEESLTKPYLPDLTFSYVPGTSLSNGLVVKDSKGNEYVWVEVPMDKTNVYKTASSKTDYMNIEKDLQDYTSVYRQAGYTDNWYDGCGIATAAEYNNLKNKMLGSIYEHGGFWLGRYETGTQVARKNASQALTDANIQKNQYPYNFITCSQSQIELANLSSKKTYTTSLLFGIQWDLTLKYMENKGKTQEELKVDSTSWGNYNNSAYDITNANAKYSIDHGDTYLSLLGTYTKPAIDVLFSTGAAQRNLFMNIYDFAGNGWEWTLEKSPDGSNQSVNRGGGYSRDGASYPGSNRNNNNITSAFSNIASRVALYQ